jgi:transcriptional regulator with XRE-family HTH domain
MTPDELKKLRKDAGLSQTDLAERLGMSLRSIQDLESGATPIREIHRLAIAGLGLGANQDLAALAARRALHWDHEIELAERALDQIDNGGMTFHEATPEHPQMRDVTAGRRQEILRNIEAYKEARSSWLGTLSKAQR